MDDNRLIETICWAMSQRSLTPGAKIGRGTFTREDVWGALGAARKGWEDAGPDLIYLEAHRLAQCDNRSPVVDAEKRFAEELAAARAARKRFDEIELLRNQQRAELESIQKALKSAAGIVVWAVDLQRVRDQIAIVVNRRIPAMRSRIEVAQVATEYALAHWQSGRYAGEEWRLEACAKRVPGVAGDHDGLRLAQFSKFAAVAGEVLHEMRNEAMSRFRRELLSAQREAA